MCTREFIILFCLLYAFKILHNAKIKEKEIKVEINKKCDIILIFLLRELVH